MYMCEFEVILRTSRIVQEEKHEEKQEMVRV
jgi:hypothetical protein